MEGTIIDIINLNRLPQLLLVICGLSGTMFMLLLPDKQLLHWSLIGLTAVLSLAALKELVKCSSKKDNRENDNLVINNLVSSDHLQLRNEIIDLLSIAKFKMHRQTSNGYFDGNSLRLVDTQSVSLCTITLESCRDQSSPTDDSRSYDIERIYCIVKDRVQPVRTICDALWMRSINGVVQIETWVPQESKEWMVSDEHIASPLELHELLGYLRCITKTT